jgi:hypothetical protein
MAKAWIEQLAEDIKQKNHEAAEEYGRAQHYAGIIDAQGKEFFVGLVLCLQENVDALRSRLQGDLTSSEMRVETVRADEVKITRARFPWVDARVTHRGDTILLEYAKGLGAKGLGMEGDAAGGGQERTTASFAFRVGADDALRVEDAFAEQPRRYTTPEELGQRITEILFGV